MVKSGLVLGACVDVPWLSHVQVKDEEGKLMNDFSGRTKPNEVTAPEGFKRTITVALDTAQYQLDMDAMQETKCEDVYGTFNVLMRRKPKVIMLSCCRSYSSRA